MLARTPVVYTKMETRKKRERNETLVEEIPPPNQKLSTKRAKKVATPTKSSPGSPKISRSSGKSPSPQKKGKGARAKKPIQLERLELGPPEEPPVQTNQPSLIALKNAHLQHIFINQLSLRHANQEEQATNRWWKSSAPMSTRQTRSWYSRMQPSDASGRPNQMTKNVSARRKTSSMPVPYCAP